MKKKVSIIGIGMGNPDTITVAGARLIQESQLLIGAKRMVESLGRDEQKKVYAVAPEDIMTAIEGERQFESIAVLMSGDLGFFSGTKKLRECIRAKYGRDTGSENLEVTYIPGISSLSYISALTGISWDDAKVVSLHGRDWDYCKEVRENSKVFFLTDSQEHTVRNICRALTEEGLSRVKVTVGSRLSYDDEEVITGTAEELSKRDFHSLSVMFVENTPAVKLNSSKKLHFGIADEEFIRGQVPMTKEEVRTLAVSKLNLERDHVVYDIGAGTGSISVQAALLCSEGRVYSIETNPEALELLEKNRTKFDLENLKIVGGMAPSAMEGLEKPDRAFIGGSKGNLKEIIETLLSLNPDIRIVIDTIALETLGQVVSLVEEFQFQEREILLLNIAKGKQLGSYNLMMGQNPVFIISLQGGKVGKI